MPLKLLIIALLFIVKDVSAQQKVIRYNVQFDFDKSRVPDTAAYVLKEIVKRHLIDSVRFNGHCDSFGNKNYNYALSNRRVRSVQNILLQKGLIKDQLLDRKGWGKDKPLNTNKTEELRQQNRRVELVFFLQPKTEVKMAKVKTIELKKPEEQQTKEATKGIPLSKATFKTGELILIPGLNFQGGRHYLLPRSKPILKEVKKIFLEHPKLKVQVQGHVCCTTIEPDGYGIDKGTNDLSFQRASAIVSWLTGQGINPNRLQIRAFGGTRKINLDENTEFLKSENRRVEFLVLSND